MPAVARAAAEQLAAPQRAELAAMRAHNAELLKLAEFTDVTPAPEAKPGTVGSPIGAALTAVSEAVKTDAAKAREQEKSFAQDTSAARKSILDNF